MASGGIFPWRVLFCEFVSQSCYTPTQTNTHTYTMVQQIKSAEEFEQAIATEGKLVIIDFFATWCGPCKMISPMVEKFAVEYSQAAFFKLDVDEVGTIAQKHDVTAMPTFLYFKDGKEIARVVGANPAGIKQTIAQHA